MATAWYQVTVEVPAELSETVADYLTVLSGCGVCTENRDVDSFSEAAIPVLATARITCYFAIPCQIEHHVSAISAWLGSLCGKPLPLPEVTILGEEDWATSWKIHFKPLEIGTKLLVLPSWEAVPPDSDRAVIVLDPGMAFGTGGHETTRLCLEQLEALLEGGAVAADSATVLDLGTGSGILAIAAAKLGVKKIDAVDIDPLAVTVASENCSINHVSENVLCSVEPPDPPAGGYSIILANILAEELVRLAPEITGKTAAGGYLILSGILAEREELVIQGFEPFHVTFEQSLAAGEWRCLLYRRTA